MIGGNEIDVMPYALPRLWFNRTKQNWFLCLDVSGERIRGVNHVLTAPTNIMLDAVGRHAVQRDCFAPYVHDVEVDDFRCRLENLVLRDR